MMTPTPNFAWRTLWPIRHAGAGGVARGEPATVPFGCAQLRLPHSDRSASSEPRRSRADSHCTSSRGTSSTKRDAMP